MEWDKFWIQTIRVSVAAFMKVAFNTLAERLAQRIFNFSLRALPQTKQWQEHKPHAITMTMIPLLRTWQLTITKMKVKPLLKNHKMKQDMKQPRNKRKVV